MVRYPVAILLSIGLSVMITSGVLVLQMIGVFLVGLVSGVLAATYYLVKIGISGEALEVNGRSVTINVSSGTTQEERQK